MFLPCSQMYKHSNNKTMTSGAIAAMLSTILYGRRFFPYYVYNIIGGLDDEGKYFSAHRINLICKCICIQKCVTYTLYFGNK